MDIIISMLCTLITVIITNAMFNKKHLIVNRKRYSASAVDWYKISEKEADVLYIDTLVLNRTLVDRICLQGIIVATVSGVLAYNHEYILLIFNVLMYTNCLKLYRSLTLRTIDTTMPLLSLVFMPMIYTQWYIDIVILLSALFLIGFFGLDRILTRYMLKGTRLYAKQ